MKKTFLALALSLANFTTYAQTNTFPPDGNVGIGTMFPVDKLVVNGNQRIFGNLVFGADQTAYFIHPNGNGGAIRFRGNIGQAIDRDLQFGNMDNIGVWTSYMTIGQQGFVGIGTTNPDTKLAVNGTIHAREMIVDLTNWPDYVFKPTYNLLSLNDVKSYIKENHHLPDIPSEKEVIKEGINLGDMNKLLIKKVEELTLYLIQQKEETDKQNKLQQQQINKLKHQIVKLGKSK